MNTPRNSAPARWAPWWAYLVPILAIDYLRQGIVSPSHVGDAVSIALFAAAAAVIAAVVTVVYRLRR